MEYSDIIKIGFGALLGLFISIGQAWLIDFRRRGNIIKLLSIELPCIHRNIIAANIAYKNKLVLENSIPVINFISPKDYVYISKKLGSQVYELDRSLKEAENSRNICFKMLKDPECREFKLHSHLYGKILISIDELFEKIEMDSFQINLGSSDKN